ncbi:hypothetical protein BaRGS_00009019 [Batillaria attramentaria]|uniref:Uncharacterized protein n=1 Tax=Batillaria attramentaria TaxID=370345 RepID=A0ABD0LKJ0_9CAEN
MCRRQCFSRLAGHRQETACRQINPKSRRLLTIARFGARDSFETLGFCFNIADLPSAAQKLTDRVIGSRKSETAGLIVGSRRSNPIDLIRSAAEN